MPQTAVPKKQLTQPKLQQSRVYGKFIKTARILRIYVL